MRAPHAVQGLATAADMADRARDRKWVGGLGGFPLGSVSALIGSTGGGKSSTCARAWHMATQGGHTMFGNSLYFPPEFREQAFALDNERRLEDQVRSIRGQCNDQSWGEGKAISHTVP
jgi:hypothetical protein